MRRAVEVTTKHATVVDSLSAAWEFVMERIELVGSHPSILISPVYGIDIEFIDGEPTKAGMTWDVVVEGMVEER